MFKKIIFGFVGIVVLGMLISIVYMLMQAKTTPTPVPEENPQNEFPMGGDVSPSEPVPISDAPTLSLKISDGSEITVKNFLSEKETVPDTYNSGNYSLGNHFPDTGEVTTQDPPYVIQYVASTQYFNIGLYSAPIGQARLQAEQYLMEHLGITKEQMCNLNYMVSVPYTVSEEFSSMSLGFSFCPDSVKLP